MDHRRALVGCANHPERSNLPYACRPNPLPRAVDRPANFYRSRPARRRQFLISSLTLGVVRRRRGDQSDPGSPATHQEFPTLLFNCDAGVGHLPVRPPALPCQLRFQLSRFAFHLPGSRRRDPLWTGHWLCHRHAARALAGLSHPAAVRAAARHRSPVDRNRHCHNGGIDPLNRVSDEERKRRRGQASHRRTGRPARRDGGRKDALQVHRHPQPDDEL